MDETVPDWDFNDYICLADDVNIKERHLYWEDWKRFSSPQKQNLLMGGFFGQMTIEGGIEPFIPLLRLAEMLHVGKGTVLGMGKVKVLD